MGKYPNEKYMRLKAIADTEAMQQIKVTKEESDEVKEYKELLKKLQQEAKDKGMAR